MTEFPMCCVKSCCIMLLSLIHISRNYCLLSGRCYYVTWNNNKENKILFLFEWRLHLPGMGNESIMCFRTFIFFIREASWARIATFREAVLNPWTLSMLATDIKETRPMPVAENNCFTDVNIIMKVLMGAKSEKLTS